MTEAALLVGVLTGTADSILLHFNCFNVREVMTDVPSFTWIVVTWTWMTLCCAAGLIFSSPRLGWFRPVVLAFVGPGVLLLSRASTPFRNFTGFSTAGVLLVWLVVTCVIAAAFASVPLAPRRYTAAYAGATLVSVVALVFLARGINGYALASRTPVPVNASNYPNVLLIFVDTVRYDDALGPSSVMPQLAQFARSSVSFDNAWAPAPWTVPSHFAILAGVEPWVASYDKAAGAFKSSAPALAQRFAARGYRTIAIFANPLLNPRVGFARGFDQFTYSRGSRVCRSGIAELLSRSWLHDGPRSPLCSWFTASEVTARALKIINGQPTDRPYFLALNYLDGHDPYYVEPDCRGHGFRPVRRREREAVLTATPRAPANPELARRLHTQYREALRCVDRSLGGLVAAAQKNRNTVVVIVGDHGEQFGEHGLTSHGNSVYRQVLHVPLIVIDRDAAARRILDPVSISDLYPFIARASEPSRRASFHDLRRLVMADFEQEYEYKNTRVHEEAFAVVIGPYHYIRWSDGREAVFDYAADPQETTPLPPTIVPQIVAMRNAVSQAAARKRQSAEFNAVGYLH